MAKCIFSVQLNEFVLSKPVLKPSLCILTAMRAGKCPFEISHLTVDAGCCVAVTQDTTEQFFRKTAPFVVLPASASRGRQNPSANPREGAKDMLTVNPQRDSLRWERITRS